MALYRGPIIDSHHHLWSYGMGRHLWLDAGSGGGDKELPMGDVGALRRDFLPSDYLSNVEGEGIVATVHVEGGWQGPPGEETAWLDGFDRSVVAARHVFHVDLAAPDAEERVAAEAAHPRAAGVRDILAWHPDPARSFVADPRRMSDPRWRRGLGAVARAGLVCELLIFPWQAEEAAALIEDVPETTFVLEHCGSPIDRSADGMTAWSDAVSRLGRAPNLMIKVSNPFAYDHRWTLESLRPVVGHCLDAFGPARTMFGSDYPVAGLHASSSRMMEAYRELTCDLEPDEQASFFHATAAQVYRLRTSTQQSTSPRLP